MRTLTYVCFLAKSSKEAGTEYIYFLQIKKPQKRLLSTLTENQMQADIVKNPLVI